MYPLLFLFGNHRHCTGHSSLDDSIFNLIVPGVLKELLIRRKVKLPLKGDACHLKQAHTQPAWSAGYIDVRRNDDFAAFFAHPLQFSDCGIRRIQQMKHISCHNLIILIVTAL